MTHVNITIKGSLRMQRNCSPLTFTACRGRKISILFLSWGKISFISADIEMDRRSASRIT
jgi:hypothetical protein